MTTITEEQRAYYEPRVAAGAAWLNGMTPGWERTVDLGTLDLNMPEQCICGQVFHQAALFGRWISTLIGDGLWWPCASGYNAVLDTLGRHSKPDIYDLGFNSESDDFAVLDELWTELIKGRFARGELSG